MKNLVNFFFSFDKLFKEKLIVPFFWLALIVWGLGFFATALDAVALDPLAGVVKFVNFWASIFLALVTIRIISEIFVAIFRINDNLSPDGGKSESADIDPVAEARRAAEMAAARTREMTKTASDKTRSTLDDVRHSVEDTGEAMSGKAKAAVSSMTGKSPSAPKEPTPVKALEPSAVDGQAVARKRGRPKGSKNKPKAAAAQSASPAVKRKPGRPKGSKNKTTATSEKPAKSTAEKSTGVKKRGPKPGQKVPRDADGNLLKKDGTPRKKPGPKAKP